MRVYDLIKKKRDGNELSTEEIEFFVSHYTSKEIPDYQASALCMAIFFRGMSDREIGDLTLAMANSGEQMDLSQFGELTVDKHSTGGVGDKTSLVVTPILASLGAKIAKMSGRGLGHTGGTVDKLESVPGFQVSLKKSAFAKQVQKIGLAVIGQSGNLTPADKKLYALRDVTATVDSIPLIASSVMSKKLAAGSHNIVLDVKVGSGAFMKTREEATALAEQMVRIGNRCGRNVCAVISDMNEPLGNAIGNRLEVAEAVEVLNGKTGDLYEVCVTLATQMACLVFHWNEEEAKARVLDELQSKRALSKMKEWLIAQGGEETFVSQLPSLPSAKYSYEIVSKTDGYLEKINAEEVGLCAMMLGAGRETMEETINPDAGIVLHRKVGEYLEKGQSLCTFYTSLETIDEVATRFQNALTFSSRKPQKRDLIVKIIK